MKATKFTGNIDLDRTIISYLSDEELGQFCKTSQYARKLCKDDTFWMNRAFTRFRFIGSDNLRKYKKQFSSWRDFYIAILDHIEKVNVNPLLVDIPTGDFRDIINAVIKNYVYLDAPVFTNSRLNEFIRILKNGLGSSNGLPVGDVIDSFLDAGLFTRTTLTSIMIIYILRNFNEIGDIDEKGEVSLNLETPLRISFGPLLDQMDFVKIQNHVLRKKHGKLQNQVSEEPANLQNNKTRQSMINIKLKKKGRDKLLSFLNEGIKGDAYEKFNPSHFPYYDIQSILDLGILSNLSPEQTQFLSQHSELLRTNMNQLKEFLISTIDNICRDQEDEEGRKICDSILN